MTQEERELIERLSDRVATLEFAQRGRKAFWEIFWILLVGAIAVGPFAIGALVFWGPWVVAAIAMFGFAAWQTVAWLIRRGGEWWAWAFVAYQILGSAAAVCIIAYVAWSYLK